MNMNTRQRFRSRKEEGKVEEMKKVLIGLIGIALLALSLGAVGLWVLFTYYPNMKLTHEIREEFEDVEEGFREEWQEFKALFSNVS